MLIFKTILLAFLAIQSLGVKTGPEEVQENLCKWQGFSLNEVQLHQSPFSQAMAHHSDYVLSLSVDRLIPHVLRNNGLQPKGELYGGWESGGGCTYGHYLTSCALFYKATGDERFLERLNYMVSELKRCSAQRPDGWFLGKHILGGLENLLQGKLQLSRPDEAGHPWDFNGIGNAWYSVHKVLAGLRDAYLLAGNSDALELWKKQSDVIADYLLRSNTDLIQGMLSVEQGGIQEVMTDIYRVTGDERYRRVAEKLVHFNVIYPTASGRDVLFNRHANDQIPKFVGAIKHYEAVGDEVMHQAARQFWNLVTEHHTLAIGGNASCERFGLPDDELARLEFTSAETCNTYNMLRLTRELFLVDGDQQLLDYYELALCNHILGSLDPCHSGGVTYYTTLQPGGYKQYSTPYHSFWCCVGTGLENHAKYGENIFFHNEKALLVGLFIASTLDDKETGLRVHLDAQFQSDQIDIQVERVGSFRGNLKVRCPAWCDGQIELRKNGRRKAVSTDADGWLDLGGMADGDNFSLFLPKTLRIRWAKGEPHFGTFCYGPLVLAGDMGTEGMEPDIQSNSMELRTAKQLPLQLIPKFVGALEKLPSWFSGPADSLHFVAKDVSGNDVSFVPYYQMHHRRHSVYWKIYTPGEWENCQKAFTDYVLIGDPDNERLHELQGSRDTITVHNFNWACNRLGRYVEAGGEFSYKLRVRDDSSEPYQLICTFWGDEARGTTVDVLVEGQQLATVETDRVLHLNYFDETIPIPLHLTKGKENVRVTFRPHEGAAGCTLYNLRITSDVDYR